MPIPLTAEQAQHAEVISAAGTTRYKEEPVLVGQLRKPPGAGWQISAIPIRQKIARQIVKILDAEKAFLDSQDPIPAPKVKKLFGVRRLSPVVKKKKWTGEFDF